jgi:hypothetical protein
MKEKFENIMDNENLMFGDAAYDSNVLHLCTLKTPIFLKVFYFIS